MKRPKRIKIVNRWYSIKYDKDRNDGEFSTGCPEIVVGTKDWGDDYSDCILLHECVEALLVETGNRASFWGDHLFLMTHKEFCVFMLNLHAIIKQLYPKKLTTVEKP